MAKYYNNRVKTGKVAGSVFSIRYGETIERAYQPIVANPSTPAQVESRAKLKLLSQLAAVVSPVLAISRQGAVSSRNLFVKTNYGLSRYANAQADINLNLVQLTRSVVSLPAINATRSTNNIVVDLVSAQVVGGVDVSRVVYTMFVKQSDGTLRYVTSRIASQAGESGTWGVVDFPLYSGEIVFYAYGVRDNTDAARAMFGNMTVDSAETVAKLIVSRNLTESDVTLTETRGVTLAAV